MPNTITIPDEYGYVLLTVASTFFVSAWHGIRVIPYRTAAGIPTSNAYATQAQIDAAAQDKRQALYLFSCAQRAQANYVESYGAVLPALLIAGLKWPRRAAVTGAVWTVSRILYAVGYTRKDRENGMGRAIGEGAWIASFVLYGMVTKMAYEMLPG